jgi:hypothetical protein
MYIHQGLIGADVPKGIFIYSESKLKVTVSGGDLILSKRVILQN